MPDESTLENDAREACLRCRHEHHNDQLKPLWRFPRFLMAFKFGGEIRAEAYGHYCSRCRRTMNVSVTAFAVMIVLGLLAVVLI